MQTFLLQSEYNVNVSTFLNVTIHQYLFLTIGDFLALAEASFNQNANDFLIHQEVNPCYLVKTIPQYQIKVLIKNIVTKSFLLATQYVTKTFRLCIIS